MQMKISEIKINPGRRDTQQRNVEELARSIAAVGLMNPITVTQDNTLIAGLHRLEAVKLLEQLVQTAANLTPEAKKTIRDAGDKITKGAALKISRLPPDQQEEAAAVLTVAPPAPKRQGMMDSEAALSEFKALCARYVSGIEALHHRADIFAEMSISQFDALGDSAYSVTSAIKEFFEQVHEIRHEMEKEHEN